MTDPGTRIRRWLATAGLIWGATLFVPGSLQAQSLDDELLRDLPPTRPAGTTAGSPPKPSSSARNSDAAAPTAGASSDSATRGPGTPAVPGASPPGSPETTVPPELSGTQGKNRGPKASNASSGANVAPSPSPSPSPSPCPSPSPSPSPSPAELTPADIEGEDLGETPIASLQRAQGRMMDAARRLESGDASPATQGLQTEALAALDTVLRREAERRRRSGTARRTNASGKAGKNSPESPDGRTADERSSGNRADGDSQDANKEPGSEGTGQGGEEGQEGVAGGTKGGANANVGKAANQPLESRAAVMDTEAWGQLPPQLRERLRNALPERFLPGFEPLLEAYYRRLAETPKGRGETRP